MARIKAIEVGRTTRGSSKHLTNQEIAETVGVSETQVRYDLNPSYKTVTSDAFVDDSIIDAEIIEDEPVNYDTGEILAPKVTDPAPAEPTSAITCPTCHGTGKVRKHR